MMRIVLFARLARRVRCTRFIRHTQIIFGLAEAVVIACLAYLVAPTPALSAGAVPTFSEVQSQWRSSDALLLDRYNRPLHRLRVDAHERRLEWLALDDISNALRQLVVQSEDQRFYEHAGVDWTAVASASLRRVAGEKKRGASTLTMQLAGLIDPRLTRGRNGRSWSQKVDQAWLALQIERRWRKEEILEAYLNLAPFRGELVGIAAAAQVLFGKHANGLDRHESALLSAMLRAPNASADRTARRACDLLAIGDCTQLEGRARIAIANAAAPLSSARWSSATPIAPSDMKLPDNVIGNAGAPQLAAHVAARLLRIAGEHKRSSLDADVQLAATTAIQRHLSVLAVRQVHDAALVVLDNASGEVLAWVGSSGPLSPARQVDGVLAKRQAGSTLKPFGYAAAIEHRWLTAASTLDDSPLDLATASGLYTPQNYDRQFKGPVTVRTALGSSLNIPAVRALVMVGPDRLFERLKRAGLESLPHSGDYYGYSLALGSADVSLLELSNAYRTLANGGVHTATKLTVAGASTSAETKGAKPESATAARRAFDPATSFIINDILADRNARAITFGTENILATRGWAAVKTGTSKDMRDNWCIGFTDRYTVGVWVGNFNGDAMWNVSGTTGAAPIWADLVGYLHRGQVSQAPLPPPGLIARHVALDEASRTEWFIIGTEQADLTAQKSPHAALAVLSPVDKTAYALDPDIPPRNQRITFQATGAGAESAQWRLAGRSIGHGAKLAWAPEPGHHQLELFHSGARVATREFDVRGAEKKIRPPKVAIQ